MVAASLKMSLTSLEQKTQQNKKISLLQYFIPDPFPFVVGHRIYCTITPIYSRERESGITGLIAVFEHNDNMKDTSTVGAEADVIEH